MTASSHVDRYASKICMHNVKAVSVRPCIVSLWTVLNPEATCSENKALSAFSAYITASK
jgi:hypothetical protein